MHRAADLGRVQLTGQRRARFQGSCCLLLLSSLLLMLLLLLFLLCLLLLLLLLSLLSKLSLSVLAASVAIDV
jgi:hypothetical protein